MKKSSLFFLVTIVLASSVNAQGIKNYIGLGWYNFFSGDHEQTIDVDYSTTDSDYTSNRSFDVSSASGGILKIGFVDGNHRVEIGYISIKLDADIYFSTNFVEKDPVYSGFDLDYSYLFGDSGAVPYFTIGFGLHGWDGLELTTTDGYTVDRSALSYNYGIGLIFLMDGFDFDIAYKGKRYDWDDMPVVYSNATVEYLDEMTSLNGIYIGLNIHY